MLLPVSKRTYFGLQENGSKREYDSETGIFSFLVYQLVKVDPYCLIFLFTLNYWISTSEEIEHEIIELFSATRIVLVQTSLKYQLRYDRSRVSSKSSEKLQGNLDIISSNFYCCWVWVALDFLLRRRGQALPGGQDPFQGKKNIRVDVPIIGRIHKFKILYKFLKSSWNTNYEKPKSIRFIIAPLRRTRLRFMWTPCCLRPALSRIVPLPASVGVILPLLLCGHQFQVFWTFAAMWWVLIIAMKSRIWIGLFLIRGGQFWSFLIIFG